MYSIGTLIVYGSEGICKITDIKENSFDNMGKSKSYYILTPLSNDKTKIFIPCDNDLLVSRMLKVLSADEIRDIIAEDIPLPEWIADNRRRNKAYKDILQSYDRRRIISLAKLLYSVKEKNDSKR